MKIKDKKEKLLELLKCLIYIFFIIQRSYLEWENLSHRKKKICITLKYISDFLKAFEIIKIFLSVQYLDKKTTFEVLFQSF